MTNPRLTKKENVAPQHVGRTTVAFLLFSALAICVAIHLLGIGGDFLSDDFVHASWIADAQSKGELFEWLVKRLYSPLGSGNYAYRPVVFASYALDWTIYGTSAAGWHLTNLIIHLVNGTLILILAKRLSIRAGIADARFVATSAAAIFLAIPFAGESTFWPVGRFDLLACMFSLGFLLFCWITTRDYVGNEPSVRSLSCLWHCCRRKAQCRWWPSVSRWCLQSTSPIGVIKVLDLARS